MDRKNEKIKGQSGDEQIAESKKFAGNSKLITKKQPFSVIIDLKEQGQDRTIIDIDIDIVPGPDSFNLYLWPSIADALLAVGSSIQANNPLAKII